MTLYGYARVSVREPEGKNLDLQVERLVRAGCSLGNIRAEEASGARNDRGGLLELLDLVLEGDTLAVVNEDGHIVLSWEAPDDDSITGYQILRRRPTEGEDTLLVYVADTQSTAATFTDTDVTGECSMPTG